MWFAGEEGSAATEGVDGWNRGYAATEIGWCAGCAAFEAYPWHVLPGDWVQGANHSDHKLSVPS
jgi:hypothetical protein